MKAFTYLTAAFCLMLTSVNAQNTRLTQYVDTRVGTAPSTTGTAGMFGKNTEEYGQTLPAVLEPNGMNFWTAQTQDTERKCKAPYYYKDTRIQGFRNSHWIVGGCTQDYGSMTLMATSGQPEGFERGSATGFSPEKRASRYSHLDETATPSYYSVQLKDYGIQAEMTGRSRSAIFRFTYNDSGDAFLIVNPNSDEGQGFIEIDRQNHRIKGCNPAHRIYQGWGEPTGFSGWFVIEYVGEPVEIGTFRGDTLYAGQPSVKGGEGIGAYLRFHLNPTSSAQKPVLMVKAASSFTSIEAAEANLQAEIPHWNFDQTRQELASIWERQLSKINVTSNDETYLRKFYGALYRSSFLPREMNDVSGSYPSFSKGMPIQQTSVGRNYYDDFSMWDTYRALHPLLNIISPTKVSDMMQSLVDKYTQGGWLPIFPCWNSYTAAMIGDHCTVAISDAYVKGIRNFDIAKAVGGMAKNAFITPKDFNEYKNGMGRRALQSYMKYGYIPLEDSVKEAFHTCEQTSRTLEYAFDDFALLQVLKALPTDPATLKPLTDAVGIGIEDARKALDVRSHNWRNVIDPRTGYAQGRHADGTFLTDDNAFRFSKFITEGAPCHYTWYVPHDVYGLMEHIGGRKAYSAKLDSMFTFRRYWHGNEPCHQIVYMFCHAGEPWKTQREVRRIMQTEYLDEPGGLSGNDDAGQMSAWYVFSAMGFYPVCPATPYYIIGSPSFSKATISLENGHSFTITARNASHDNVYIQSARLNGKPYNKSYISHSDITRGGTLEFVMGDKPNKKWATNKQSLPPSGK